MAKIWCGYGRQRRKVGWVKVVWELGVVSRVELINRGRGEGDRKLAQEIKSVLEGRKIPKRLRCIDGSGLSEFARKVLNMCAKIKPGEVMSYKELARAIGKPKGARAVGQVMANNPFPLLIPCHRVVAKDGRLGGFAGGLKMKIGLLEAEGWRVIGDGWNARVLR
ncbi:MAG: MGMT family protein [candidate division WOR-3 bacterium]